MRIDVLFVNILEKLSRSMHLENARKIFAVRNLILELDTLKFMLKISWEIKILDDKAYIRLSEPLSDLGKILGGWLKYLKQNSPNIGEK